MARIAPAEYNTASPAMKKEFDEQLKRNGRITNMKKTLLHSLPAFHALMQWYDLRDEALLFLTERELNIFAHSISFENDCLICSTFFRRILIEAGDDPDHLNLTEKEKALIEFGRQCVNGSNGVSNALFQKLKSFFIDSQIVLLTAFAGLMIATNLVNNALKIDLDEYLINYTKR